MSVTALIPYFSGTSSATHSSVETRAAYLDQTVESVKAHGFTPIIGVRGRDVGDVKLDTDPVWLPYALMVWAQENVTTDLVYVTEADQVLHMEDDGVLDIPNGERYLSPWRLDLIGPNGERESNNGFEIQVDGLTYNISNGGGRIPLTGSPLDVVEVRAMQGSFGGAYLCTVEYFRRIRFRKMRVCPVEHATGFDAKTAGTCVKTASVSRFWLDHLSPRDRYLESAQLERTQSDGTAAPDGASADDSDPRPAGTSAAGA
jgi:hypothetical protein